MDNADFSKHRKGALKQLGRKAGSCRFQLLPGFELERIEAHRRCLGFQDNRFLRIILVGNALRERRKVFLPGVFFVNDAV